MMLFFFLFTSQISAQFSVNFDITEPTCYGLPDGSVTASSFGGTAPYNYFWSTGQFGATQTGLTAGTYTVTVSDAASQQVIKNVTINQPPLVTVDFQTDVCNIPFEITAIGGGGIPPYSYHWSTGSYNQTITNLPAGTYCITLTDSQACGATSCVTVAGTPLLVSVSTDQVNCANGNDGTLTAFPSGGTAPYSFAWSNGAFGQTISGLFPGSYGLTLTDANGCTATAVGTVSNVAPVVIATFPSHPQCAGENNGSISLNVSGGTPPYTYLWNTGQNTSFINNLPPGTYSVTVTDAHNCPKTAQVTLIQQSNLTINTSSTPETCTNFNNGTMSVTASQGVQPYTYNWSNGATTSFVSNVAPGTYFVTVTDNLGCTKTGSVSINPAPSFQINVTGTNATTCGVNNGTATANIVTGVGPFTYQWSNSGNTANITGLGAGTYSVTVTNSAGCQAFGSYTVIVPPNVFVNVNATNQVCMGSNTGTATAFATGGTAPFSYQWSNGGNTQTINNLVAGTYIVTVSDTNGCSDIGQATIGNSPQVIVNIVGNNVVCGFGNTGVATANVTGGTPPFTYTWSNDATTATTSGLTTGVHFVVVTDANGCTGTAQIAVTVVDDFTLNVMKSDLLCFGDNTGSATAIVNGGGAPYTYQWSNGANTQTVNNLTPGTYTVTVTEVHGCQLSQTVTITQPQLLTVAIFGTNMICLNSLTGTATANPQGGTPPYSYVWSNGAVTQTISNLSGGTYTVTVTDSHSCQASGSITINETPALNIQVTATEVVCGAENTGSASVNVSGGIPPYTYAWSSGGGNSSVEDLEEGSYTVTVTDALGCTGTAEFAIDIIDDFSISVIPRDVLCFGDNSGSILVNATGGSQPYSYQWSNGANTAEITNLPAGIYIVTVTEANDCKITEQITITQPQLLVASAVGTNALCADMGNGSAIASATGGTQPYQYNWSNEEVGASITGLMPGDYSVTVTDANFCTSIATVMISAPNGLDLTVSTPIIQCGGTSSGEATALPTGGTPPYTYMWSTGANTQILTGIGAGTYGITVTDANGCTATSSAVTIQELPQIQIDFEESNISCSNQNIGAITANVSGGTPPFVYVWSNGMNIPTITNLAAGSYSLTVTDANNCQVSNTTTITQTPALAVSINVTPVSCNGGSNGTATAIVTGGTAPFTYTWSNSMNTASISGLLAGTYSLTVSDAMGCTGNATMTITQPTGLSLEPSATSATCNGMNTGQVSVDVSGGTPGYSFAWTAAGSNTIIGTQAVLNNVGAGTYNVAVTDANGCVANTSATVTQPNAITIATSSNQTCVGDNSGSASATASGGTPPYTYSWSNGQNGPNATGLSAGVHSVTAIDANNCSVTTTVSIANFAQPSCSVVVLQESTLGNNGELRVTPSGGTAPYTYLWSNGANTATVTGLAPGTHTVTVTDANGCTTNCSATLAAYSGIGNFVWEDSDKDGIQDPDEVGFPDVTVKLKDASGTVIATTTTDADGFYSFMGLNPGTYSVMFVLPYPYEYTGINSGADDAVDSDADETMDGMTITTVLEPGEIDLTWDAGIYRMPNIAVGDPCHCLDNATSEDNGQFTEEVTVYSNYTGETWTIVDQEGLFIATSPEPPFDPIEATIGMEFVEVEPGVYQLPFRLVHAIHYVIYVSDGHDTLTIENTCYYPTIGVVDLPPANLCLWDDDIVFAATPNIPGELSFTIDGQEVSVLNPNDYGPGVYELVVELVPFDENECTARIIQEFEITDDCSAKIGDFVWLDSNHDGIQDPGEQGIPGVKVTVTGVDEEDDAYMDMTFTDNTGMYMFLLPPGTYKVTFTPPAGLDPTAHNAGSDDTVDSDMDPNTFMTQIFTIDNNEMNLTLDAGFTSPCENITDPGEIGYNQFLCGPGNTPDPLVSIEPASGGAGAVEYLWMMSVESDVFNPQTWTPVPDSNTPGYAPGPLYRTTRFARCARREGCSTYIETSNVVIIEVGNVAVADISGPSVICEDQEYTYYAVGNGNDAVITWDFGAIATPSTASGTPVTVSYPSFGSFTINLTVTEDGCTSHDFLDLVVTNSPTACGGGMPIAVTVVDQEAQEVMVAWQMESYMPNYEYQVEYSRDGVSFQKVATVTDPVRTEGDMQYFEYTDIAPKKGRSYYRVLLTEISSGDQLYSNTEEVVLFADSKLAMVYPNPVTNNLTVELFEALDSDVQLELISATGRVLRTMDVDQGVEQISLDFAQQPAGTYFIRLRFGKSDVKTLKVLKF